MKKVVLLILLLASACGVLQAQESTPEGSVTLKGRVTDETGSPIEIANIWVARQLRGTTTNLKGEYTITLTSADTVEITFSMIGYQSRRRILHKPTGTITLDIMLPHSNTALQGVTIRETRRQTGTMQHLSQKKARLMPDASGGTVESFIATQAGVSSTNELSSTYNVRGGNYDENSVYVNGLEVYRPLLIRSGQQEGLSFVNADMVEKVDFSAGGFDAQYGDKMSSVLDIQYKRPTAFESRLNISLLGASAYLGWGDSLYSQMHGIRYKTSKYMLGALETKGKYNPNFIDYQTQMTWKVGKQRNWDITFLGNFSQNTYEFKPDSS